MLFKDVSEDVLKESSISDDAQYANSFSKNEKSMLHKLEMDTDTVGVETLLVFCDVKNEQSDPEGIIYSYLFSHINITL